ncbi:flagellar hook-associated protein FlgK [Acidobacteria bacterium AB60]|nr:flagellar hook-associated protein FlgK [Acidobacteria bacterium AB60]
MSGLNTSLSIAMRALQADQGALDATNNNIANANTPGYSRQVAVFTEAAPDQEGPILTGNGVDFQGLQSIRDELLNLQIAQQTSQQSSADTQSATLQQIETVFSNTGSDIASSLSAFYSSLSRLSANPASTAARQGVLSAAQTLATSFNSTAAGLANATTGLNTTIDENVLQVNQLTSQIAQLDQQLAQMKAAGTDGGSVQDQHDQLVLKLSKLTGITVTRDSGGESITTANGSPLVVDGKSFALQTTTGTDGNQHVLDSNGTDITASLQGGSIGGAIQVRDHDITGLVSQLNTLASQFATAINAAQASGFDQSGKAGQALFSFTPANAAATIAVTTTDPTLVAASSDGTAGSNGNVANLLAVQNSTIVSGQTPSNAYASMVFQVGNLSSEATAKSSALGLSLTQLTNLQGSVSGVNIDEESTNLIRFQTAYEAAARVISTVQQLGSVILNMGSGGGF